MSNFRRVFRDFRETPQGCAHIDCETILSSCIVFANENPFVCVILTAGCALCTLHIAEALFSRLDDTFCVPPVLSCHLSVFVQTMVEHVGFLWRKSGIFL